MAGRINIEDTLLRCVECGLTFVFSTGERAFFISKSLSIPKRCPDCRRRRRATLVPDREAFHDNGR